MNGELKRQVAELERLAAAIGWIHRHSGWKQWSCNTLAEPLQPLSVIASIP